MQWDILVVLCRAHGESFCDGTSLEFCRANEYNMVNNRTRNDTTCSSGLDRRCSQDHFGLLQLATALCMHFR